MSTLSSVAGLADLCTGTWLSSVASVRRRLDGLRSRGLVHQPPEQPSPPRLKLVLGIRKVQGQPLFVIREKRSVAQPVNCSEHVLAGLFDRFAIERQLPFFVRISGRFFAEGPSEECTDRSSNDRSILSSKSRLGASLLRRAASRSSRVEPPPSLRGEGRRPAPRRSPSRRTPFWRSAAGRGRPADRGRGPG